MVNVIINADDFGKDHVVNIAIKKQIEAGNITSTTIMANADGFYEAIEIAKNNPQICQIATDSRMDLQML